MARIFLICKVRGVVPGDEEYKRQQRYVAECEQKGDTVHWPHRDTVQEDPEHGTGICRTTFWGIYRADEIHVIWDVTSEGRLFDFAMVFALRELRVLVGAKKIVLVNREEVEKVVRQEKLDGKTKSYTMVLLNLVDE